LKGERLLYIYNCSFFKRPKKKEKTPEKNVVANLYAVISPMEESKEIAYFEMAYFECLYG